MLRKDKILQVFDMDDTLVVTNALQFIVDAKTKSLKCAITSDQYIRLRRIINKLKQKKLIDINYDQFADNKESYELLKNGEKVLKYMCKLRKAYYSKDQDVAIVTARGNSPKQIQAFFLELYDINIPMKMIKCMNWTKSKPKSMEIESQSELTLRLLRKYKKEPEFEMLKQAYYNNEKKKIALFNFIDMGYRTINFYDDDIKNTFSVKGLKKLESSYENLNLTIYHIPDRETRKLKNLMNTKPQYDLRNFTYPTGRICRDYLFNK